MKSSARWHPAVHLPIWIIPLLVLILLLLLAFRPSKVLVDTTELTTGAMSVTIDEEGRTRVRERYVISSPLAARVPRIDFEPGDDLCVGQEVVVLDPGPPHLLDARAQARAEAALGAAEAAVTRSLSEYDARYLEEERRKRSLARIETLHKGGTVSAESLDEAQTAAQTARRARISSEQAVRIARFDKAQAEAVLNATVSEQTLVLRAPVDGVVLRVFDKNSRSVQPGSPLVEMGDPDNLEILIDVLSADAVRIRPGQRVWIEHWGGERRLAATVRRVEPTAFTEVSALGVDEQRVNVIADFDPGTQVEGLGDGFRLEARIVVWDTDQAVLLPTGALFRDGDGWSVYRVVDDRSERVRVRIGRRNGDVAEVRGGLEAGEEVVLHPGDRVDSGSRIQRRGE